MRTLAVIALVLLFMPPAVATTLLVHALYVHTHIQSSAEHICCYAAGDEDEVPESDFMKAFKVANFTIVEQPVQGVHCCWQTWVKSPATRHHYHGEVRTVGKQVAPCPL